MTIQKLNGISIPDSDMRGRAFPYKENGPHFAGPCVIEGQVYCVKVWENQSSEGRRYLRFVFESPEESGLSIVA